MNAKKAICYFVCTFSGYNTCHFNLNGCLDELSA
jgi:hypothetical protein